MFKSVFSKYFVSISAIIMSSFLVMTTIQVLLFTRSVAQDKRTLLTENAGNIARHTAISAVESQTQGSGGVIYRLDQAGMNQFLTMMSDAIDASIFVTDDNGRVLLATGAQADGAVGSTALSATAETIGDRPGEYFEVGDLGGLAKERQYTAASPVRVNAKVLGYVFVSCAATTVGQTLSANWQIYVMSTLGTLVLTFIVVYLMTYRIVSPLRRMAAATRRFAKGDFSVRVKVDGNDEVAELASALDHMATSLSSLETMRRSFIANVSHELKTPMTTIAGFVDGMLDGTIPPDQQPHYMKIVSDEVKRLSRLVRSMLDLSRIDSGQLKMTAVRLNLTEIVGSVLVTFEQRIEQKRLQITGLEDQGDIAVNGDHDLLGQVIYNLIDNAVKFTNEGGTIEIRLFQTAGRVQCRIRNTGAGIPAEEMPQLFDRFYKSDRSRSLDKNGLGLGLFIVKTVIDLHHGQITVRSVEGEYTEFAFWLPAADPDPEQKPTGSVQ